MLSSSKSWTKPHKVKENTTQNTLNMVSLAAGINKVCVDDNMLRIMNYRPFISWNIKFETFRSHLDFYFIQPMWFWIIVRPISFMVISKHISSIWFEGIFCFVLYDKNFNILGPEAETSDLLTHALYKLHYHTNTTTQRQKEATGIHFK